MNEGIKKIFEDFISAMDEAIITKKVLDKIPDDRKVKPNQLLFSHIVNTFDAFVSSIYPEIIFSTTENIRKFYDENNKNELEKNITYKVLFEVTERGLENWIKSKIETQITDMFSKKRHAKKLKELLKEINIRDVYVQLMQSGDRLVGFLKDRPTNKSKRTRNHHTITEDIIGYADILYEKRNGITHNKSQYRDETLKRLNEEWKLKIKGNGFIVKSGTIMSTVRYYSSLLILIAEKIGLDELIIENLESLRRFENILSEEDGRSTSGGIIERRKRLITMKNKKFGIDDYSRYMKISDSTSRRDVKLLIKEGILQKNSEGLYEKT